MNRKSGRKAQELVWAETRDEFESKVPESKEVYALLDS
jgi:hypothetical protein